MDVKPIFLETILALSTFASKDETRPVLMSVKIEKIENAIRLEVTNGIIGQKRILSFDDFIPEGTLNLIEIKEILGDKPILISTNKMNIKSLKEFLKNLKNDSSRMFNPTFSILDNFGEKSLKFETYRQSITLATLHNSTFPKLSEIIDTSEKEENFTKMTLSIVELEKVLKFYKDENKKEILKEKEIRKEEITFFIRTRKSKNNQFNSAIFLNNTRSMQNPSTSVIMPKN